MRAINNRNAIMEWAEPVRDIVAKFHGCVCKCGESLDWPGTIQTETRLQHERDQGVSDTSSFIACKCGRNYRLAFVEFSPMQSFELAMSKDDGSEESPWSPSIR